MWINFIYLRATLKHMSQLLYWLTSDEIFVYLAAHSEEQYIGWYETAENEFWKKEKFRFHTNMIVHVIQSLIDLHQFRGYRMKHLRHKNVPRTQNAPEKCYLWTMKNLDWFPERLCFQTVKVVKYIFQVFLWGSYSALFLHSWYLINLSKQNPQLFQN